jgi:hypothetical protein
MISCVLFFKIQQCAFHNSKYPHLINCLAFYQTQYPVSGFAQKHFMNNTTSYTYDNPHWSLFLCHASCEVILFPPSPQSHKLSLQTCTYYDNIVNCRRDVPHEY